MEKTRAPAVLLAANYGHDVGYAWNNIFRLFNALARHISRAGLKVCVSFRDPPASASMFDDEIDVTAVMLDPRRFGGPNFRRTRELIRDHNIRYLYLTDQRPIRLDYALLRMLGVRSIVIHNRVSVPDPYPAPRSGGLGGLVRAGAGRLPLVQADRVYAVSEFVARRLADGNRMPPARIRKILNGIDVDKWLCPSRPEMAGTTVFFAGARATRYKGVLTLIRAAAEVRDVHGISDFLVRFAGDGPEMELLQQEAERLRLSTHFTFLGRVHDLRPHVCGADVVIVPSEYGDACPSTVSEALASGRALIATRAGGIPELVGGPTNALIVPPGDPHALAGAMAELARNPVLRAQLAQHGRLRAEVALSERRYHQEVIDAISEDFGIRGPNDNN